MLPALERGGYEYFRQVDIGERLGGGKHIVDLVAYDEAGTGFLISLKWQQTSGTAEQKVPYEAMCLIQAVLAEPERYEQAYLVLGGPSWTLRDFFTDGGLLPLPAPRRPAEHRDPRGVRRAAPTAASSEALASLQLVQRKLTRTNAID